MPAVEKFMCCAQLRTGAIVIGWVGLTMDVICLAGSSVLYSESNHLEFSGILLRLLIGIILGSVIISILANMMLLWAVKQKDRFFLVPWLTITMTTIVFMGLELLSFCILAGRYHLDKGTVAGKVIMEMLFTGVFLYAWVCIQSYYEELRLDSKHRKGTRLVESPA